MNSFIYLSLLLLCVAGAFSQSITSLTTANVGGLVVPSYYQSSRIYTMDSFGNTVVSVGGKAVNPDLFAAIFKRDAAGNYNFVAQKNITTTLVAAVATNGKWFAITTELDGIHVWRLDTNNNIVDEYVLNIPDIVINMKFFSDDTLTLLVDMNIYSLQFNGSAWNMVNSLATSLPGDQFYPVMLNEYRLIYLVGSTVYLNTRTNGQWQFQESFNLNLNVIELGNIAWNGQTIVVTGDGISFIYEKVNNNWTNIANLVYPTSIQGLGDGILPLLSNYFVLSSKTNKQPSVLLYKDTTWNYAAEIHASISNDYTRLGMPTVVNDYDILFLTQETNNNITSSHLESFPKCIFSPIDITCKVQPLNCDQNPVLLITDFFVDNQPRCPSTLAVQSYTFSTNNFTTTLKFSREFSPNFTCSAQFQCASSPAVLSVPQSTPSAVSNQPSSSPAPTQPVAIGAPTTAEQGKTSGANFVSGLSTFVLSLLLTSALMI